MSINTNIAGAASKATQHDHNTCEWCRWCFGLYSPFSNKHATEASTPTAKATTEAATSPKAADPLKPTASYQKLVDSAIMDLVKDLSERAAKERRTNREVVTRAVAAIEKRMEQLPTEGAGVAGYLVGLGIVGDKTVSGNAFAKYLRNPAEDAVSEFYNTPSFKKLNVSCEQTAILVECGHYTVAIKPPPGVETFLNGLMHGLYPRLIR